MVVILLRKRTNSGTHSSEISVFTEVSVRHPLGNPESPARPKPGVPVSPFEVVRQRPVDVPPRQSPFSAAVAARPARDCNSS